MAVTKYGGSVAEFCEIYGQDSARAENCGKLFDGGQIPPNVMGITAVPGRHFSSFAFGGSGSKPDLTPFAVIGKYEDKGGRVILPLCVEFAHEVNDGYHETKFFEKLEEKLERFGG
jgi:chloramphenicol O-acetyltransferase type A